MDLNSFLSGLSPDFAMIVVGLLIAGFTQSVKLLHEKLKLSWVSEKALAALLAVLLGFVVALMNYHAGQNIIEVGLKNASVFWITGQGVYSTFRKSNKDKLIKK